MLSYNFAFGFIIKISVLIMKRTVLLSLGFAAALVANASIKESVQMNLPQTAVQQGMKVKDEKKVVAASAVYNQKVVSAGKLVKSFKNMGIYQTEDGKYVRVLNKNNKLNLNNYSKSQAVEAAADASFSENFDGWDGETANWLPTGWSQESKVGSDANVTWGVAEGNYYAVAYDTYALNITAALDLDMETFQPIFPEQDEWCYSPAFTVAAGDYLSFMLNYDPGLTLLNWDEQPAAYVYDAENTNLEVLVSSDNGANWNKIWDAVTDAKTYSDEELYNITGTSPWKGVACDLSAYAGQSVKLAFRFVGSAGNDMMIDNLSVGDVTPVASYTVPSDMFVFSAGEYDSYYPFARLAGAYAKNTFTNNSGMGNTYQWEYYSSEDGALVYSDDKNLSVEYPYGQYPYPVLTSYVGENASEPYEFGMWQNAAGSPASSFWQTGGYAMAMSQTGEITAIYPVVNWERYYNFGSVFFGGLGVNDDDAGYTANFGDEGDELTFDSFASLIMYSGVPYAMDAVYLTIPDASVEGDENANITVSVYRVTAEGTRGELIGSGTCLLSDDLYAADPEAKSKLVPCYFTQKIGALTQQMPLTIDDNVLVCVSADKSLKFNLSFQVTEQTGLSATGWGDGLLYEANYVILEDQNGQLRYYTLSSFGMNPAATGTENWALITGIGMEFSVFYNWMFEESGNYSFVAPVAGGESQAFVINTLLSSDYWTIEGDGLYDWVDYVIDDENGTLTFTATALPSGVTGRSTTITVSTYGASPIKFTIQQGEAGVEAVETSANRVSVVNGNFEVEAAGATSVDVYNVAGQKVASAAIEGTTVVPAQDLAKGLYILKFNDNTAVKVMK